MMPRSERVMLAAGALSLLLGVGCPSEDPGGGFRTSTPPAGIRGVICAPNSVDELAGVNVSLFADDDEDGVPDTFATEGQGVTDATGEYQIEAVPAGTYVAMATVGHHVHSFPVVMTGGIQQRIDRECMPADSAAIGVYSGTCGGEENLLTTLGFEVTILESLELLTNAGQLNAYDVLIASCGMSQDWLPQDAVVAETLESFLAEGSSLYVSGDAWPLIEALDEDHIEWVGDDEEPEDANVGFGASVQVTIADPTIAEAVGGTITVTYEDNWSMIAGLGEEWGATAFGAVQTLDGTFFDEGVLAATRFPSESGQIRYSTFGATGGTADQKAVLSHWLTGL